MKYWIRRVWASTVLEWKNKGECVLREYSKCNASNRFTARSTIYSERMTRAAPKIETSIDCRHGHTRTWNNQNHILFRWVFMPCNWLHRLLVITFERIDRSYAPHFFIGFHFEKQICQTFHTANKSRIICFIDTNFRVNLNEPSNGISHDDTMRECSGHFFTLHKSHSSRWRAHL